MCSCPRSERRRENLTKVRFLLLCVLSVSLQVRETERRSFWNNHSVRSHRAVLLERTKTRYALSSALRTREPCV